MTWVAGAGQRARRPYSGHTPNAIVLCLAAALLAGPYGCATTAAPDPLAAAFAAQHVARARELAPDLYGRAEQARREAAAASRTELRDDARARAELWLQAALAEATRIGEQRAASAAETRVVEAEAARIAVLRERERLEHELALAESERASKLLASNMLRGGALAAAARGGSEGVLAQADAFALGRATALLAAARALGLAPARIASLDARLASHASRPLGPARVRAAIELLAACERALGDARLPRPSPTEAELASLRADALERGLSLELAAEGAAITLEARTFPAGRVGPNAEGAHALTQLASLLRLHARGVVLVQSARAALEAGRARAVAARLRAERPDLRVEVEPSPQPGAVRVVLPAYRAVSGPGTAPGSASGSAPTSPP